MPKTTVPADAAHRAHAGAVAILVLARCASPCVVDAAVTVTAGPTTIPEGEAIGARDLTVANEKLAFAMAVDTPVPYGVPRGAIVDVAPVVAGRPASDRVVFADFIPNNWSAWPNTYQKVEVVRREPSLAVVESTRDWGQVALKTTYTLRAGSDRIELRTTMTNTGATVLEGLLSGQTLWPGAGFYFGLPGLGELQEGPARGALADRAVAYDEDWAIALHAPYADVVGSRSKDLFLRHSLRPGETRSFDAWLQVVPRGDLGPVVASEIERRRLPAGSVAGVVTTPDGTPVASPVVVVSRLDARAAPGAGVPYAWCVGGADGRYAVTLPAGDYELSATAKGYSQARPRRIAIAATAQASLDFRDVQPPGRVAFTIADARGARPVDARITVTRGQQPLVEYLGRSTFFTELDPVGKLETRLAPGAYEFRVSSGGGFTAPDQSVAVEVKPGGISAVNVLVRRRFDPRTRGWHAADLHHHADQAEGVTPPADLARAQLAAGLDLLFVSDHDSTVSHAPLQRIADMRGVPFIPAVELSPSWAHFNAWPLRPGQELAIDTGTATIDQVLAEARRQGALVVQANHPLIPYGYFASLRANVVPGGFNPAIDLAEINADVPYDDAVLQAMWAFWNEGHRYYLSGGTDVHDVWNHVSGRVRVYAHVDGPLSPLSYAAAVKAGHAYVSYGPLVYPATVMFGDTLKVRPAADFGLAFELQSIAGLRSAKLIGAGRVVATRTFHGGPPEARVEFERSAERSTWYALEVEDVDGKRAFTNPVWIDVVTLPPAGWKPPAR